MSETFGQRLRRLRCAAGLSQSQLARLVPISQSSLSRYESDTQAVDDQAVAARLDELLGAAGTLAAALRRTDSQGNADSEGTTDAAPSLLDAATEATFSSAPNLARLIADRAARFRRLDDFVGGRELYPSVRRSFDAASSACNDDTSALSQLSELGQVAGWVASDAGHAAAAAHLYLAAATAGNESGRPDLSASALSSLSYQLANSRSMRERAEAVLLASAVADHADGAGRALVLERLAWAHARVGDENSARRVLDEVDEVFDEPHEVAPTWAYWLDRDEITVMRGRCMVELGRPAEAVDLLATALSHYDRTRAREYGLYATYLAEALVQQGDRAEAQRLLDQLPQADSARLDARVEALT